MISFDAETVTGGTTGSDGFAGAGSTGSKTDGIEGGAFSTLEVTRGSLGSAFFIFRFISRLAAFWARAICFCRTFICLET